MRQHQSPRAIAVAVLLATVIATPGLAAADSTALRREAFELAYNLDHDQALARLRKAVTDDPSDAAAHRALASILWLHMLFTRGATRTRASASSMALATCCRNSASRSAGGLLNSTCVRLKEPR